jgi:hypothetical protein
VFAVAAVPVRHSWTLFLGYPRARFMLSGSKIVRIHPTAWKPYSPKFTQEAVGWRR